MCVNDVACGVCGTWVGWGWAGLGLGRVGWGWVLGWVPLEVGGGSGA